MHLPLRLIFCRRCLNFINVRAAYASKIQAPPTKNPLANSGTTRFREHIICIPARIIIYLKNGVKKAKKLINIFKSKSKYYIKFPKDISF